MMLAEETTASREPSTRTRWAAKATKNVPKTTGVKPASLRAPSQAVAKVKN